MVFKLVSIYMGFFVVWICTIPLILKRNQDLKQELWNKCWSYFLITSGVLFLIGFNPLLINLILVLGLFELLINYKPKVSFFLGLIAYLLISFLFYIFLKSDSFFIAIIYLSVISFDASSQIFGLLIGKKKINSKIIPKKTFEGAMMGFFSVAIVMIVAKGVSLENFIWIFFISFTAFIGDFMASYLKRKIEIKDFSKIFNYHGGILDRFDSFLFSGSIISLINYLWGSIL